MQASGRPGLVAYVTAGDPNLDRTVDILTTLGANGSDVLEVGVPFSDPLADGPVIQRASERALKSGTTLKKTLEMIRRHRAEIAAPIVLFTYVNPIVRMGEAAFARGEGRLPRLLATLERVRLLIIDDWGPEPLNAEQRRDLLEILDDRYDRGSLLVTSQIPINRWHEVIGDPTLADAILDRIIHRAHRIDLKGPSLRRRLVTSESSAA